MKLKMLYEKHVLSRGVEGTFNVCAGITTQAVRPVVYRLRKCYRHVSVRVIFTINQRVVSIGKKGGGGRKFIRTEMTTICGRDIFVRE